MIGIAGLLIDGMVPDTRATINVLLSVALFVWRKLFGGLVN